ncbi:MAG: cytochrome c oxidase assembly protein [Firmicutes bacterium]|nr:cytochrome c oxidase assembly protein [Bacillota bacterium]
MNRASTLLLAAASHPAAPRAAVPPAPLAPFVGPWQAEPTLLLPASLAALLYAAGWLRLRRAGGAGTATGWRAAAFAAGLLTVLWALLGPLDDLGDRSFAFHMVQHEVLTMVSAPLLLLGLPGPILVWAPPRGWSRQALPWLGHRRWLRRLGAWLGRPAVAWALFNGTLLLWHLPPLYNAAQGNDWTHYAEHLSFLATALVFWAQLVGLAPRARRLAPGTAAGYVAASMPVSMLLGIWFLFSPVPVYAHYAAVRNPYGWSVLLDQQLAGAVHLLLAMVYMMALVGYYLARLLAEAEEREASLPRPGAPGAGA